mgnify:CR=1 FL=1
MKKDESAAAMRVAAADFVLSEEKPHFYLLQMVLVNSGFVYTGQIFHNIPAGHLVLIATKYPVVKVH